MLEYNTQAKKHVNLIKLMISPPANNATKMIPQDQISTGSAAYLFSKISGAT